MSETFGISGGGRSAEERFRELTGAQPSPSAAKGDAVLEGHAIEVKRATANTLNQVRAVKYITLVAYHVPSATWYVVPAHAVVAKVCTKARGQHTENPFESATLSISNLGEFRIASEADLADATRHAIAESNRYPELRDAMERVLAESKALARKSGSDVQDLLRRKGLL